MRAENDLAFAIDARLEITKIRFKADCLDWLTDWLTARQQTDRQKDRQTDTDGLPELLQAVDAESPPHHNKMTSPALNL